MNVFFFLSIASVIIFPRIVRSIIVEMDICNGAKLIHPNGPYPCDCSCVSRDGQYCNKPLEPGLILLPICNGNVSSISEREGRIAKVLVKNTKGVILVNKTTRTILFYHNQNKKKEIYPNEILMPNGALPRFLASLDDNQTSKLKSVFAAFKYNWPVSDPKIPTENPRYTWPDWSSVFMGMFIMLVIVVIVYVTKKYSPCLGRYKNPVPDIPELTAATDEQTGPGSKEDKSRENIILLGRNGEHDVPNDEIEDLEVES